MLKILNRMLSPMGRTPTGPRRHPRKRHRSGPGLECLEGREVPATIAVTTTADVVNPLDGKVSLREAITMANATAVADVIQLKAGVYGSGIAGWFEDANAKGDFDITNPLTIAGAGAAATVVDGAKLDRVFEIHGAHAVTFSGVTIRNGSILSFDERGGGIGARDGSVTLLNSIVTGNEASTGGGISTENGNVTLRNSRVAGNLGAFSAGGGVYAGHGTVRLDRSILSANHAKYDGGGIFAGSGAVTLTDSTVSGNSGGNGGGIFA